MEQHHYYHQRQTYVRGYRIILSLQSIKLLGIHSYTPVRVTRIYHKAIQFKTESKECIRVRGDQAIHILPTTRIHTRKQRPKRKPHLTLLF